MRKRGLCLLLAAFGLVSGGPAVRGELCTIDAVPAATLLLPSFEINLRTLGKSKDTITTIELVNESPAPALAHVVLWTRTARPTLGFAVFLTGYDVQQIRLNDLFLGRFPEVDCPTGVFPAGTTAENLRSVHDIGGRTAAGYVTIDNVNECSRLFPNDEGFFLNGGTGVGNNVLCPAAHNRFYVQPLVMWIGDARPQAGGAPPRGGCT